MNSQVTEAIYSGGVLKLPGKVSLHESGRVQLIIERSVPRPQARHLALELLRAGIAEMPFTLSGPLPGRDELHDRV